MKSMLAAFVMVAVIAICADIFLNNMGFSTQKSHAGSAVRLGDKGQ